MRGQPARVQPMANGETPLAWSRADMQSGTATFTGNGATTTITVSHGLGSVPSQVILTIGSANTYAYGWTTKTATSFTVSIKNSQTGAPVANLQVIPIDWIVIQ